MSAHAYLGFDYGTKHLGIAVGGSASGRAETLATASVRQGVPDWPLLDRLINEWKPTALIVGLPLNMDDSENAMTQAARKFGHRLQGRYNLPVHLVDERLTSVAAKNTLVESRTPWKQRRTKVDKLAAQTILQAYLDGQRDGQRGSKKEARHAADE